MPKNILRLVVFGGLICAAAAFAFFFKNDALDGVTIPISGMNCPACVDKISRTLRALEGVANVEVSLAEAQARVQYDPTLMTVAAMENAIAKLGFGTKNFKAQSCPPQQQQCETNSSSPTDCCAPQDKRSDT